MLYQSDTRAFDGVAAWRFDDGNLGPSEADQTAVRVRGARVTANFFDVLGVPPALGRGFAPGEDRPGAPRVVVLSHRIWQERLHGDPDAIGRQIVVNDVPRTIVGIMPPRFAYPARHVELWLPLALDPAQRVRRRSISSASHGSNAACRSEAARADLARVLGASSPVDLQRSRTSRRTCSRCGIRSSAPSHTCSGSCSAACCSCSSSPARTWPASSRPCRARADGARRARSARLRSHGDARADAERIRAAERPGRRRRRVVGGVAMRAVRSAGSALSLPRLEEVGVDAPVLLFALGITVFCALSVSVLPLLRARRASMAQVLRGAGSDPRAAAHKRARNALVVSQIALAVVLVALSGLMTRSLLRLHAVRPGFDADHVVTSRVLLPYARYGAAARLNFFEALVREAKAIPGVRDVALTDWVPLSGDRSRHGHRGGGRYPLAGRARRGARRWLVFQALRIPLLRGRTFGAQDAARPSDEAIVSQRSPSGTGRARAHSASAFVRSAAAGTPSSARWATCTTTRSTSRRARSCTFPSSSRGTPSLVVRTDAGEGETLSAIRGIVRALDPAIPTYDEGSLRQLVDDASARARALAVLLAMASVVTSLLGAVGLYGIMAYSVSIRRRELGIRMALGARPRDVSRMVSLVGLRLAGVGIVIGMACALLTSQLLRGLLYGVSPTDPVTLSVTPVAVFVVAFIASWIPARRAAAVHPAEALRSQ